MREGKKKEKLDDIDREILWLFRKNPFLKQKEVAERLPRQIGAIKARMSDLQNIGYLRQGWLIDSEKEIFPFRCLVHLKLYQYEFCQSDVKNMDGLIEYAMRAAEDKPEYSKHLIVQAVYQTFGESDIVFELLGENESLVANFIVNELADHRGVVDTTTQPVFQSKTSVLRKT